jgi:putative PIN family toxin of toxin-antitoxin system
VRAVIDTNVLLSGLLWHGQPHMLLEHVRAGTLAMVSSPALLAELADVIGRAKFDAILVRSKTSREQALAEVRQLAEVVEPPPLPQPVCRDPDDDEVLALALAAQVDLIVSGDDDLLVLQAFEGIPILTPAQALQHIGTGGAALKS